MKHTWITSGQLVILLFTPQIWCNRTLFIDPIITPILHEEISSFTDNALMAHAPHDAAYLLKQQFPVIGAVVIDQRLPQRERIAIDAARPHALINKEIILDSSGSTYSPHMLEPSIVGTVPGVSLVTDQAQVLGELPVPLKEFIINLEYEILRDLAINWRHNNLITCKSIQKKNPWQVVVTNKTQLNPDLIKQCSCAAQAYAQKDTYKPKKIIKFDVRFMGQIVAHQ